MFMTLLGREAPALPAEVLFTDLEIEVLNAYAKKDISPPDNVGAAVKLVAKIDGCLDRSSDPPPATNLCGEAIFDYNLCVKVFCSEVDNQLRTNELWVKGRARTRGG